MRQTRVPRPLTVIVACGQLFVPASALAEVMDKEASIPEIWTWSTITGIVGLIAWPIRWPFALCALAAQLLFLFGVFQELADPHVGPAIAKEAGMSYPLHVYASLVLCAALHTIGMKVLLKRKKSLAHEPQST